MRRASCLRQEPFLISSVRSGLLPACCTASANANANPPLDCRVQLKFAVRAGRGGGGGIVVMVHAATTRPRRPFAPICVSLWTASALARPGPSPGVWADLQPSKVWCWPGSESGVPRSRSRSRWTGMPDGTFSSYCVNPLSLQPSFDRPGRICSSLGSAAAAGKRAPSVRILQLQLRPLPPQISSPGLHWTGLLVRRQLVSTRVVSSTGRTGLLTAI